MWFRGDHIVDSPASRRGVIAVTHAIERRPGPLRPSRHAVHHPEGKKSKIVCHRSAPRAWS